MDLSRYISVYQVLCTSLRKINVGMLYGPIWNVTHVYSWDYILLKWCFPHFVGPVHWGMVNVQCDGKKQSPINIKAKEALENKNLKKLELHASWNTAGSRSSKLFELKNKGYTVQLDIGKYEEIQTTQNGKSWTA